MLPTPALDLILNVSDRSAAGRLALAGSRVVASPLGQSGSGQSHRIVLADEGLCRVRACRPNLSGERAFDDVDLSISTVRIALGVPGEDPYCLATLSDPFPAAASVISAVQSATADLPATKRITLDPAPYAGTWLLTLDALDPVELPFDAEPDQIKAFVGSAYSIRKRAANAWEIFGTEPGQDITIAVDVSGLLVPVGVSGEIALNTDALAAAFAAAATGTPPTEPKWLRVTREVEIDGVKVFQDDRVEIARAVLDLSALVPTPLPPSDVATINAALDNKQPLNPQLSALGLLATTAYGRALLALADAGALRAYASAQPLNSQLSAISSLATATYGRGVLTQPDDASLRTYIGHTFANLAGKPTTVAGYDITDFNSLGDARWTQLANLNSLGDARWTLDTASVHKTGDETIAGVKTFSSPPVVPSASFAQSAVQNLVSDLALKSPLASPAFTGTPTAPTALNATSNTQVATTAFVHALFTDLVGASPATIDTIYELAAAIGDDPNFAATIASSVAAKLTKASNLSDLTDLAQAQVNLGLNAYGNTRWSLLDHTHAFGALTARPTSLTGYGITDAIALTDAANAFVPLQTFNAIASSSLVTSQLANPGAPVVTAIGTDEGVTWSYKIVAKLSDGAASAAGPAGTTTHGDATLDATNRISLSWTAVPGAASYDVYRTAVGVSPSTTGKIANVTTPAYVDTGAAGDGTVAPAVNATGNIDLTGPFTGKTILLTGNVPATGLNLGILTIAPTATAVQGFHVTQALTGNVPPNDWAANEIAIDSDNAAFINFGSALNIRHRYGGAAMAGGRNTLQIQSYLTAPTSLTGNGGGQYVAAYFGIDAESGEGGTNLGAGAKGGIFAINPYAVLRNGCTNFGELSGGEINIAAEAGSSVKYKNILSLVYNSTDAVDGTLYDCMLALSSQSVNQGKNGILFGDMNGWSPIKITGNLIATTGAVTVANGIYFPDYIFTGWALYAPHGAANVSSLSTTAATITNDGSDALLLTGEHALYTGPRIRNTDGGGDWGIYAGGSGWGGGPGALVFFDNTPTTGGIRMIINKNGNLAGIPAIYLSPLASNPTPAEGAFCYNSTDKHFYGYNGTTWKQLDN